MSVLRRNTSRTTMSSLLRRNINTITTAPKAMGDISSVFPSLSGTAHVPLPPRFTELKGSLISSNKQRIEASYARLLPRLSARIDQIRRTGPSIIPTIPFSALSSPLPASTMSAIKEAGTVHITGVLPASLALDLKASAQRYIAANSDRVRAFPASNPAVYELYWSPAQVAARSHPNMLAAQRWLQSLWHAPEKTVLSTQHTLSYADRLRIRRPGDAGFALGPHVDGGSLERWEDPEYRRVYERVFEGRWEELDPFDATHRVDARMDLYNGAGACAMFRMWQGWLGLSDTAPGEGTLRVFPALREATAYWLLKPLMTPGGEFQGATMGCAQELTEQEHPELRLSEGMVSIPAVQPGDYVAWHCDTIHAVDREHRGKGDASVFYIPTTPLTTENARYLKRQRDAAREGAVPPDFPGAGRAGVGEMGFVGAVDWERVGTREMGMGETRWEETEAMADGERQAVRQANRIMGWE